MTVPPTILGHPLSLTDSVLSALSRISGIHCKRYWLSVCSFPFSLSVLCHCLHVNQRFQSHCGAAIECMFHDHLGKAPLSCDWTCIFFTLCTNSRRLEVKVSIPPCILRASSSLPLHLFVAFPAHFSTDNLTLAAVAIAAWMNDCEEYDCRSITWGSLQHVGLSSPCWCCWHGVTGTFFHSLQNGQLDKRKTSVIRHIWSKCSICNKSRYKQADSATAVALNDC